MAIGWRWARRGAPPASWRRQVALRLAQVDKVFTSTRKKALQAKTQIYENDIMILSSKSFLYILNSQYQRTIKSYSYL